MHYILFVFLLGVAGPQIDGGPFESKVLCETAAKKIVENIAAYNVSTENTEKIVYYAVTCAEMKDAPTGDEV